MASKRRSGRQDASAAGNVLCAPHCAQKLSKKGDSTRVVYSHVLYSSRNVGDASYKRFFASLDSEQRNIYFNMIVNEAAKVWRTKRCMQTARKGERATSKYLKLRARARQLRENCDGGGDNKSGRKHARQFETRACATKIRTPRARLAEISDQRRRSNRRRARAATILLLQRFFDGGENASGCDQISARARARVDQYRRWSAA